MQTKRLFKVMWEENNRYPAQTTLINIKITGALRQNPTNWAEKEFEYTILTKFPKIKEYLNW